MTSPIILATTTDVPALVAVRSIAATLTNAQIKALPLGAVTILPVLDSTTTRRKFLGGSLVINTLAGAYTNVADPSTGVVDLIVRPSGQMCPFQFEQISVPLATAAHTVIDFVPRADILPIGNTTGTADRGGYINTLLGQTFVVTVQMDNYDGDYDVDRGVLTGGHADNYMKFTFYYALEDV